MLTYTLHRLLAMIPTLLLISVVCFAVLQLQPGQFIDQYLEDPRMTRENAEALTQQLGLDQPLWKQYFDWLVGIVTRGDFGESFVAQRPVSSLIWEKLGWTILIATSTLLVSWAVAIPLGIYTALNPQSWLSYFLNFVGYIALAIPDFLLALLLVALLLAAGSHHVGGLFSPQYIDQPWSLAKLRDLLEHLWLPMIVIGLEGVAALMRQMRASLLEVISEDFIRTAKAKGLAGYVVVWRHGVRNAINPLISLAGLSLPNLISGTIIVSIVLNLPTIGPLLYDSLLNKDQYLAMTLLLFSATLLLLGNLLADLALAWIDPRVRFE